MNPIWTGQYTKIYLRKCRQKKEGCLHYFYSHQANTFYCCAQCRYDAARLKGKKRVKEFRKKYKNEGTHPKISKDLGTTSKFKKKYEKPDPAYLGVPIRFFNQSLSNQDMKNETFVTRTIDKGIYPPIPLLSYQGVTHDDLHQFSVSYLKDNKVKCPECENRQNLIEHALNICSKCGLVLKAPPIHPGFIVDDLLSKKKVAPTVQDINLSKSLSGAFELAHTKYNEQISVLDCEVRQDDLLNFDDKDPLNPVYWRKRRKGRA